MAEKLTGAAVVGQSGGPTAAINATLAGVIRGALSCDAITELFGMKNGVEGLLCERLISLSDFFSDDGENKLELLAATPAAALGSCRKKLPKVADDREFYERITAIFKKYNIRYFFYIGGNDSMDTVAKLTEYMKEADYEMRIVGVPKTIDNDLDATDHTPGYGSAAKYIAATVAEIIRDCAVYTVPAVTIVEIMGRDAGWLTASAALPRAVGGTAPDLICLPETPFRLDEFLRRVKLSLEKHPNVVIAVSEGVRDKDGHYVGEGAQSGATDVFGHKYLAGTGKSLEYAVRDEIGCKVRSVELNISQRCAAHIRSATDINESLAVGAAAVKAAADGSSGVMMAMERSDNYKIEIVPRNIAGIANKVRCVPQEFICDDGFGVTDGCVEYILPLIQGEAESRWKSGIPEHLVF